uniref:PCI domain-containing protein n=1 Tax=Parascaris univalens TaxID=6257 RepID=A0A915CCY8_PARUN
CISFRVLKRELCGVCSTAFTCERSSDKMRRLLLLFVVLEVLHLAASLHPPNLDNFLGLLKPPGNLKPPPTTHIPSTRPPVVACNLCSGRRECAVARVTARTLVIPLSSTLRNLVKEQIDRRLELFGLGDLKNNVEVETKTILLLRFVVVKIGANCCPKILQIVLDALNSQQLSVCLTFPQ